MLSLALPVFALVLAAAATPSPAPGGVPAVGGAVRYHIVRTTQDASGPKSTLSDVVLRRKAATTATLEGTIGGHPAGPTVLNVGRDGTLYIPKSDKVANQDVATVDVVGGLNRLNEIFAGQNGAPRDGWPATLALPEMHGATASVPLQFSVANESGADYDFRADGEYAPAQPAQSETPQRGRRGGIRGGFGGRSEGEPPSDGGFGSPVHLPFGVVLSVDGQVRRGQLRSVTIAETRTVTVDSLPFTNVGSWRIEATR